MRRGRLVGGNKWAVGIGRKDGVDLGMDELAYGKCIIG
jgi:hypothetical protein